MVLPSSSLAATDLDQSMGSEAADEIANRTPLLFSRRMRLADNSSVSGGGLGTANSATGHPILANPSATQRIRLRMSRRMESPDSNSVPTKQQRPEMPDAALLSEAGSRDELAIDETSTVIEGDKLEIRQDHVYKSVGHAMLRQGGKTIKGDVLSFDVESSEIAVQGNAELSGGEMTLFGPSLRMRTQESIGEMIEASFIMKTQFTNLPQIGMAKATDVLGNTYYDQNNYLAGASQAAANAVPGSKSADEELYPASVGKKTGVSRGSAKVFKFEGEDKKRLEDARYTTCAADSNDWYIRAKEMVLDDYTKTATAKHARVDFKGVPILYTPWISFSFLNQRKSGLLSPLWGTTSQSGFELLTPFYWNIAPNLDATIGTRYLSKRGLQLQGEFRYMTEHYSGINNLEYLNSDIDTEKTRYYAKLKHQHQFGSGWSGGYLWERVSDDNYFSEMSSRIISTSRINLPQQLNVAYNSETLTFSTLVQQYQTLSTDISFPYERLPQISLRWTDTWHGMTADIKNEWVSFDRDPNHPRFAKTASGGLLTTSVTGSRLTTYPSLSLPMNQPFGYITPKIGLSHTSYSLQRPEFVLDGTSGTYQSTDRTLPILSLDSGLFFDRKMRIVKNNYTQTLEPRLYYVYIPYQDQSMLPIFDTAEADLNLGTLFNENQFVGGDRINNANQVTAAVTSRMIDSNTGEQRLAVTVGQRFYFADQKVSLPGANLRSGTNSDIVGAITARLANRWSLDLGAQYNTDTSEFIRNNIGARYLPEPGKVLNLGYRYTRDRLEQFNISGQWPLGKGWYGIGRWNYSIDKQQPIEGLAGLEYDAGCWVGRTVVQRLPTASAETNYALFFQLELGGLTSIGSNPLKVINRNIPGYSSSSLLPDLYREQNYQ